MQPIKQIFAFIKIITLSLLTSSCGGGSDLPEKINSTIQLIKLTSQGHQFSESPALIHITTGQNTSLNLNTESANNQIAHLSIDAQPANSQLNPTTSLQDTSQISFTPAIDGTYIISINKFDLNSTKTTAKIISTTERTPFHINDIKKHSSTIKTNAILKIPPKSVVIINTNQPNQIDKSVFITDWKILQKPTSSQATLAELNETLIFKPDIIGIYAIEIKSTSSNNNSTYEILPLEVSDDIKTNYISPTPNAPQTTIKTTIGNSVLIKTSDQFIANNPNQKIEWKLFQKPNESSISYYHSNGHSASLIPDAIGNYQILMRLIDNNKYLSWSHSINIEVNLPPINQNKSQPLVIAHRGGSYLHENTLANFELALKMNADVIETDLRLTKDNQCVIMHDDTLTRTTNVASIFSPRNGGYKVADFTLDELKTLSTTPANGQQSSYPGFIPSTTQAFKIPTLNELINLIIEYQNKQNRSIKILAETKVSGSTIENIIINETLKNLSNDILWIQSFNYDTLRNINKKTISNNIKIPLYFLGEEKWINNEATVKYYLKGIETGMPLSDTKSFSDGLSIKYDGLTDKFMQEANKNNLKVFAWTFSNRNPTQASIEYFKYLSMGVNGLITDTPDLAVSARNEFIEKIYNQSNQP